MRASFAAFAVLAVLLAVGCDSQGFVSPNEEACRDVGYCNGTHDVCACGTTCIKHDERYACEIACSKDADCNMTAHPVTDAAYTHCVNDHCE